MSPCFCPLPLDFGSTINVTSRGSSGALCLNSVFFSKSIIWYFSFQIYWNNIFVVLTWINKNKSALQIKYVNGSKQQLQIHLWHKPEILPAPLAWTIIQKRHNESISNWVWPNGYYISAKYNSHGIYLSRLLFLQFPYCFHQCVHPALVFKNVFPIHTTRVTGIVDCLNWKKLPTVFPFVHVDNLVAYRCNIILRGCGYWYGNTLKIIYIHIDGLVQERRNSIANARELRLSCTNPSICWNVFFPPTGPFRIQCHTWAWPQPNNHRDRSAGN